MERKVHGEREESEEERVIHDKGKKIKTNCVYDDFIHRRLTLQRVGIPSELGLDLEALATSFLLLAILTLRWLV